MGSITAANAVVTLTVQNVFSAPQQLQGFDVDDVYDVDAVDVAETKIGVDGIMSSGYIFFITPWKVMLQADSPSITLFETWLATQKANGQLYQASGTVLLPAIGLKYAMSNGVLEEHEADDAGQEGAATPDLHDRLAGHQPGGCLMARKTAEVVIDADGRDKGRAFIIMEMSAADAEAWAIEALGVMLKSGVDIPESALATGMAGIAVYGVRSLLAGPYAEVGPLLERLMACVKIKEPALPLGRSLTPDDIEEISTRFRLRDEVIKLHTGFSPAAGLLEVVAATILKTAETGGDMKTLPEPSEPSSPAARRRSKN